MKLNLKDKDFETIICEHNPFALKEADGKVSLFQDYSGAYFEVIRRLMEQCPRGYVEMALFLHDNCSCELPYARMLVSSWCNLGYTEEVMLIRWDNGDGCRDRKLKLIMTCLHTISGTSFKEDLFKIAIEKMKIKNKLFV
jgi:hypothetical protein